MTLDEALHEAVMGARLTAPHMQPGCYIEHLFSKGFVRCWPVDKPEDEPSRTQCEFRANDADRAADWTEVERPVLAVDHSPVDKWGASTKGAIVASANEMKIGGEVVGTIKSFTIDPPKRDLAAEALALMGAPKLEPKPGVWGKPVDSVDSDAPKRDSWGRPIG